MKIYNPNNTLLLDIPVSDSSFATDEIMNEDTLSLGLEESTLVSKALIVGSSNLTWGWK